MRTHHIDGCTIGMREGIRNWSKVDCKRCLKIKMYGRDSRFIQSIERAMNKLREKGKL